MEAVSGQSSLFALQSMSTKALKQSLDTQKSTVLALLESQPTRSQTQGLGSLLDLKA